MKYVFSQRMEVTIVHRLVSSQEKPFLKPNMSGNTESRPARKNKVLSTSILKTLRNAFLRKIVKTVRKRLVFKAIKSDDFGATRKQRNEIWWTGFISSGKFDFLIFEKHTIVCKKSIILKTFVLNCLYNNFLKLFVIYQNQTSEV